LTGDRHLLIERHVGEGDAAAPADLDAAAVGRVAEGLRRVEVAVPEPMLVARLGGEAQNRQPLLNWIRLHRGLANLLRNFTTQARQTFQEIETAGPFSSNPDEAPLADFFVQTARTMTKQEPVPANAVKLPAGPSPDRFALFLFAMKDWQQSDFVNAGGLLEQFVGTQSEGAFTWINDYKPLAEKFLADYRVYAEWKKQAAGFTTREQITTALTALRTAQGKLQQKGKLNEAFKEEEARLLRQMDQK